MSDDAQPQLENAARSPKGREAVVVVQEAEGSSSSRRSSGEVETTTSPQRDTTPPAALIPLSPRQLEKQPARSPLPNSALSPTPDDRARKRPNDETDAPNPPKWGGRRLKGLILSDVSVAAAFVHLRYSDTIAEHLLGLRADICIPPTSTRTCNSDSGIRGERPPEPSSPARIAAPRLPPSPNLPDRQATHLVGPPRAARARRAHRVHAQRPLSYSVLSLASCRGCTIEATTVTARRGSSFAELGFREKLSFVCCHPQLPSPPVVGVVR